jgi:hypothetical protein
MKKLTAATLNMILALGVICILAGVLFFTRIALRLNGHVEPWTVILTVTGAIVFYLSLAKFNYAQLFFIGLYSVLTGFFFVIVCSGLVSPGFSGLWPVSIVLAGISTLLTGIAKDRRIRVAYLFPSVLLMCMGSYFLLFSLDLISMSFRRWLSIFWPVFPVFLGLSLIVLFLIQQNPASHFPYDSEESEGEGEVKE